MVSNSKIDTAVKYLTKKNEEHSLGKSTDEIIRLAKKAKRFGVSCYDDFEFENDSRRYNEKEDARRGEERTKEYKKLSSEMADFGLSIEFNGIYPSFVEKANGMDVLHFDYD